MKPGSTILVTGAKGSVGNYVLGLAEAAGFRVIASDVTASGVMVPVSGQVRPADLRDPVAARQVVQGCDAVIHTAALLDTSASPADLVAVNTDAVVQLYEASLRAGVKRFLHVSAASLYETHGTRPRTEDTPLSAEGVLGMSKYGAEVFLRGRSDDLKWTIVRPAPIYGRRGRHLAASLLVVGPMLRLITPVLPSFRGGPEGSMVHAEDVARALMFLLGNREAEGQVFNVADDDVMPLGERLAVTFAAYGLPTFATGAMPGSFLRTLGMGFQIPGVYQGADAAALAAWRLVILKHRLRPALRPRLDRESLNFLYDDLRVDTSKLRSLGWRPRFPRFHAGWREVLAWYQAEGWVPRYHEGR